MRLRGPVWLVGETHRTRHAFESDRAEDAALTAAGDTVVRFTYSSASASRNASSSGSSIE